MAENKTDTAKAAEKQTLPDGVKNLAMAAPVVAAPALLHAVSGLLVSGVALAPGLVAPGLLATGALATGFLAKQVFPKGIDFEDLISRMIGNPQPAQKSPNPAAADTPEAQVQ